MLITEAPARVLICQGAATMTVDRQVRSGDDPDARERWNRRWAERGVCPLQRAPAQWLVENARMLPGADARMLPGADARMPPGAEGRRALDVACGDGRNAVYLARLGFAVDACDVSDVAIDGLRAAASEAGLAITATRMDLAQEPLPAGRYDVVVQINYLQRELFGSLVGALAPGGILVAETFTRAHVERVGGRLDERFLLSPGELLTACAALRLLRYREGIIGSPERRKAVASLVSQQPARSGPAPQPPASGPHR
jgi:tellurite methyltransferase